VQPVESAREIARAFDVDFTYPRRLWEKHCAKCTVSRQKGFGKRVQFGAEAQAVLEAEIRERHKGNKKRSASVRKVASANNI